MDANFFVDVSFSLFVGTNSMNHFQFYIVDRYVFKNLIARAVKLVLK